MMQLTWSALGQSYLLVEQETSFPNKQIILGLKISVMSPDGIVHLTGEWTAPLSICGREKSPSRCWERDPIADPVARYYTD
jgi:hypothetical protein